MATDEDLETIFKGISSDSCLQHISLRRNNFGSIGLTTVMDAVHRANSIISLEFEGLEFDNDNTGLLVKKLRNYSKELTKLTINDANFSEDTFVDLIKALSTQTNLKFLTLQRHDLNLHMCMELTNILSHQSLKCLDLSYTSLNCQGLMFLCAGIKNS